MAKPLFIAIGVHKAVGMPQLDGVLTSVKALSEWADGQGYDVIRFDDQTERVVVSRIKDKLTPSINPDERDPKVLLDRPRIVVYFCGHGLHAPQDQYWILSAGPDQPDGRITAVGFREMLTSYGPEQIAFISDACRSPQALQGLASSVVDRYRGQVGPVPKDNFFSSLEGEESFAVPSKRGEPAYCVFSSVLMRALSRPAVPEALDDQYLETGRMIVSSQSLATYLEKKVPEAALGVGKWQVPQCDSGFRPVANHYIDFGPAPHAVAPAEVVERQKARAAERKAAQNQRINRSRSEWRRPYVEALQNYMGPLLRECINRDPLLSKCNKGPLLLSSSSGVPHVAAPATLANAALPAVEKLLANFAYRRPWNQLALVDKPYADSGRSGVAVVSVADLFAVLPLHHRLWCAAIIENEQSPEGTAGGVELISWGGEYPSLPTELSAAEALKGLSARTLNAEDTAILAKEVRFLKHADPMYGIVAAYLYNAIGDIPNIRRMCYYYNRNNQDVPFDIALLAQLQLKRRRYGGFYIKVPPVAEAPQTERPPDAPSFVWRKTPAVSVNVAGVTPLLRAGWQHIEASPHAVHRRCWELTAHLTESPISTFRGKEVGAELITAMKQL
jgi:hypothetical protein